MKKRDTSGSASSVTQSAPNAQSPSEPPDAGYCVHDLVRFRIDASLKFSSLDSNFEDMTGFDADRFLVDGDSLADIVHEQDREGLRSAIAESFDAVGYFSHKFRILGIEGDAKWIWMRGPCLHSRESGESFVQGVMSDVSEVKSLEETVKAEREFFESFADALDDGICILTDDFRIRYMNKNLVAIVGDHIGEICDKALFGKEGCCSLPAGNAVASTDSCGFREMQYRTGNPRIFQVRSLPITTPGGFRGRVGQFRDISSIKRLEHKYRDFAVRVRAIAKAANMADLGIFILVDHEGQEGHFRFANQAFCRLSGYNFEELLQMNLVEVIYPDDREAAMDRYRRRLQGEPMGDTYEIRMVRKDGSPITVFFMGALSVHHGRTATVGFVRDITMRKQLQESLFLSQRLASIGKLSAEIAHEINNPLTSILTFNKLLDRIIQKQPFPVERIPELQDYIRFVNSEAGRCAEIARNLLNFSRTAEIRIKENDIHEILDKTLGILRHRAEMNDIEIQTAYSPDVPAVHCDFHRLQQAFVNIFWNAIEAMPEGGTLTVATSFEVQPQCNQLCKSGRNMIQISVTDTGVGIPRENLDRIFEPFFSTKKEKSGVGLGLSVSYGIIRKHNGQILVQSEPGVGTTFLIQFPTDVCVTCPFDEC
ncbi:MAG: PAS domain S-box protein [Desulfobacteraceae bacterium]|nr:PAS domain S-box protein [Desulfobacteraceae bacterium]